jgi:hypothetical protein
MQLGGLEQLCILPVLTLVVVSCSGQVQVPRQLFGLPVGKFVLMVFVC